MKRIVLLISAFFYLGTSTGFTMHLHYCMEKLMETTLWHSESEACGNCGMPNDAEAKKGCCKDEHKEVKLDKVHKASNNTSPKLEISSFLLPRGSKFLLECPVMPTVAKENPVSNSPPGSDTISLYLKNQSFRI